MMGDRGHRLEVSPMILPKKLPKESVAGPGGLVGQPTESSVAASVARGFVGKPAESPLPVMPIASPPPFPLLA